MRPGLLSQLRRGLQIGLGVLCLAAVPGHTAAAELTVAVSRTALSLPFYVAEAEGYFAAEGVSLKLAECIGGQRCLRRLLDGGADLATSSDLPVMFNSFARADYAVVATFVSAANDVKLIARRSAGIASAAQLASRKVGTVKGASAHYFLDTLLLFNDVDPRQVQVVDMAPEKLAPAFQNHEVDAIAAWEPNGWLAVQGAGADAVVLASPRIYTETFNLVATRRALHDREDEIVRTLRALARAQRFIAERPRDAKNILKQRLALDDAFVAWVWKDLDYRLGLDQSLITTLEAEARWAVREGHVATAPIPNYLRFVEPAPLRKAVPGQAPILQ
jgi:ABC-type nitrate/sulfonate/bicarbonate transport system substrate-binding protein